MGALRILKDTRGKIEASVTGWLHVCPLPTNTFLPLFSTSFPKMRDTTISSWIKLGKKDLMEIPWMKEVIEVKNARLFVNVYMGFPITEITDGGIMDIGNNERLYIEKNITTPSRLKLFMILINSDGISKPYMNVDIEDITVSTTYGSMSDGFRVYQPESIKYKYDQKGNMTTTMP